MWFMGTFVQGIQIQFLKFTLFFKHNNVTVELIDFDLKELYCRVQWFLRIFKEKTDHNKNNETADT